MASIEADLLDVTVYASGARVRRVTTVNDPPPRVRIVHLPVSVIDDTVRVEVEGPAIATAVRVAVDAPGADDAAAEATPATRASQRGCELAEAEVERLGRALEILARAPIIAPDPTDEPPPPWPAMVAARRSLVSLRATRELGLREQLATARRSLAEARRTLEAEVDREHRTGSVRAAKLHELRKHVELELVSTGTGEVTLHLEYQVAAARWAPSYVARLEGERATIELRAVVAQDSGEDWAGVPLQLSTAEPARFAMLPELAAQRIGRRQQEPVRAGFRAPPTGAEALFADYDRVLGRSRRRRAEPRPRPITGSDETGDAVYMGRAPEEEPAAMPEGAPYDTFADEVWDEQSSHAKAAFHTPPGGSVAPPQQAPAPAAPMLARKQSAAAVRSRAAAAGGGERSTMLLGAAPARTAPPAPPPPRLDYGNLVMAPPASAARGTLIPAGDDRSASADEVTAALALIVALPLPRGCIADWAHTYDYAFVTDGAVDVRADGAWHAIAVTSRPATAKLRHVSVPREQADVFRVAAIESSFAGPLLPGPIDVYDHGRYLVTSEVDYTPPGASVEIGLGVDAAVKIARNTTFHEEATGMLRGVLRLHHAITIDVENLSGRAIELEVRERIPVSRAGDDEVEVTARQVEPAWERWTPDPDAPSELRLRGGHRWRLALPAGAKRTLRAGYEVKIATKLELVGGNRRES